MNFQLRLKDLESTLPMWLHVETNPRSLQKQMASGHKQLTRDLQIQQTTSEGQVLPKTRKQRQNSLLCPIKLTDFLVKLLMCDYGLLLTSSVFCDSTFLYFPPLFSEKKKKKQKNNHIFSTLFLRMSQIIASSANRSLAGLVAPSQLQGSLKLRQYLLMPTIHQGYDLNFSIL